MQHRDVDDKIFWYNSSLKVALRLKGKKGKNIFLKRNIEICKYIES